MLIMKIKFCKLNNNEIFNVTLISDADLTIIIILNYKLNFKFIKLNFKLNSETSHTLSFKITFKALFKFTALSY